MVIVPSGATGDDAAGTSCACAKAGTACRQVAIAMRLVAPICSRCVRNVLNSIAILILSQPPSLFLVTLSSSQLRKGLRTFAQPLLAIFWYNATLTCPVVFIYATTILLVKCVALSGWRIEGIIVLMRSTRDRVP